MTPTQTPPELVQECQLILAHAWMVRAFLRHCEDCEDSAELSEFGREIFDLCRALEPHADTPVAYFRTLRKKIGHFQKAVAKFGIDAPQVSVHTNFIMAVESINGCLASLSKALNIATETGILPTLAPPASPLPGVRPSPSIIQPTPQADAD
ncbi:amidohydrolase [Planctomicrobium sp. SH527]|uniref:amidohydrolase n=1 Tax=Planctomicrobium sp. SH527 TaxID=3448123 RepID=UPI003F5C1526